MAEAEAKWYVVHTYSGYENKVKLDIEKTIANNKNIRVFEHFLFSFYYLENW